VALSLLFSLWLLASWFVECIGFSAREISLQTSKKKKALFFFFPTYKLIIPLFYSLKTSWISYLYATRSKALVDLATPNEKSVSFTANELGDRPPTSKSFTHLINLKSFCKHICFVFLLTLMHIS
jgi:hypothetical protein